MISLTTLFSILYLRLPFSYNRVSEIIDNFDALVRQSCTFEPRF